MAKSKTVEIPGAAVESEAEETAPAADESIVPTEAELALIAAMRNGATLPKVDVPQPAPDAPLKDASEYDTSKLTDKVLTKQGWLLPTAAQAQANG